MPSTASRSSMPPRRTPSSSPVRVRSVARRQCRAAARRRTARGRSACCRRRRRAASVERIPWADANCRCPTEVGHRPQDQYFLVVRAACVVEARGERLGGEPRLVVLAPELLHRDVARGVDLGARDDPRRAGSCPTPRRPPSARGRTGSWPAAHLEVELVAEVGRVLGQHAVAEEREDGGVLALELELELGLELVELVEMAHGASLSARPDLSARRPTRRGAPRRCRGPARPLGRELGERLEREEPLVEARVRHAQPRRSTTSSP